ncbi:hypothetical protein ACMV_04810 [Acidiphilium multivorum AIU301]|uniref:Transposase n=1 Tax=Acidiphilium multivorum (strain DSM 11245 / JCM 8867 / NBRC 100883 / AIU 301) TaxID=926570 RepID=F0J3H2_ACIMA|nr:hypothetical protein ACMV_04810 [Acidiphilium multivorum AIU301]
MARRRAPAIPDDLLDQLLAGGDAAAALNSGDLVNALKKALAERALSAEMDYHLSDEAEAENSRNGHCQEFRVWAAVEHQAARALTKRSPKMTAN